MASKKKIPEKMSAAALFGVSEKDADAILDYVLQAQKESDTFLACAERVGAVEMGEAAYVGYVFGRLVAMNENKDTKKLLAQMVLAMGDD